jgi:L-aspartate oxidase
MWEHAGLVRDERGLRHAASVVAAWRAAHRAPRTEAEFEDENLLVVAERLVAAALSRRESIGAHFRRDAAATVSPSPEAVPAGVA